MRQEAETEGSPKETEPLPPDMEITLPETEGATEDGEGFKPGFEIARRLDRPAIEEHRRRLGKKFGVLGMMRGPNQWVHWDRVSTFAQQMGDLNPLWNSEDYAQSSCYGTVVAPPAFIMSVWRGMLIQGLPGVHIMMAGNDYEFYLPLLEGDKITAECVFARLEEKRSKFAELWLVEDYDSTFRNQQGQLAAKQVSYALRHERSEISAGLARTTTAAQTVFPHPWTEEELTAIEDEQLEKKIQGSTPLFWEDVNVGDELPDLVRGPLRMIDTVAHLASHDVTPSGPAGILFTARRHRGYAFLHPLTRAHEHIVTIHWDKTIAEHCGFPHPYDFGHNRQMWLMNAVTDWMGDHGWLKKNSARYRRMVFLSDVVRIKSRLAEKYVDANGEHCVDIWHTSMNQREENVMPGQSTVILPSREKGTWPVQERLDRMGRGATK